VRIIDVKGLAHVWYDRSSANAASSEQHVRYQQMRSLLDADPEWHDGEVIQSMTR
jgi:hypothetical protein